MINAKRLQGGFTIVELLIVVVVIAILAAVTIVAYNGISNRAKDSAVQSAVTQAFKKVASHAVLSSDVAPETLDETGIDSSGSTQYQYTKSTAGAGSGFCITATQAGRSAYMARSFVYNGGTTLDQPSATVGACPGHSASGGTVITNLMFNPGFEAGLTQWGVGGNASYASSTDWADTGTRSMRVTNLSTANSGDLRTADYSLNKIPYGLQPGKTYTVSARLYMPAAPTGSLNRSPGVLIWYSVNGSTWTENFGPKPPASAGVHSVSHTFTLPANATGAIVGFGAASTTANQTVYYDSVMLTEGSTPRSFADGTTAGWIWKGTPSESASTGPAL